MKNELIYRLIDAVDKILSNKISVGVAFSGGIDSSLLALICKKLEKNPLLLTIGFAGSSDLEFSKIIATKLQLTHETLIIENDFNNIFNDICNRINCTNISHIENCIAYSYICRLAKANGIRIILTANGLDELFCGYKKYQYLYDEGFSRLSSLMDEKLVNEFELMNEIKSIASDFELDIVQPFMTGDFISFAKTIPFELKIKSANDLLRKHILREVALALGVPAESAMRPKKALQYGSLIDKNVKRLKKYS